MGPRPDRRGRTPQTITLKGTRPELTHLTGLVLITGQVAAITRGGGANIDADSARPHENGAASVELADPGHGPKRQGVPAPGENLACGPGLRAARG